ncbi:hypothetical protein [Pseudoalteromonas sp. A757]|nr:hypothetical protein [Pseudoalteromonas sp. A757]
MFFPKAFTKSLANIQGKPKYIYLAIGGAENDITMDHVTVY